MKNISLVFLLLFTSLSPVAYSEEAGNELKVSCENYTWDDVIDLVQPHLDDTLYTALIMQGQSSEYSTSAAAIQAMDRSLPADVKRILNSLIEAGC